MGCRATQRINQEVLSGSLLDARWRWFRWTAVITLIAIGMAFVSGLTPQAERAGLNSLYCEGRLADAGINPYLLRQLAWCERNTASRYAILAPAPEPPYDLSMVSPLTKLPFRAFALVVFVIMAAALAIAAGLLAKIVHCPILPIALALAPLALLCARKGELLTVVCLSALCVGAYYLSRRRYTASGVAVAVAMCDPQLALPTALSLLMFAPRSRPALLIGGVILCALSVVGLGTNADAVYVLAELPRQLRAELASPEQFGIPWITHALGASIGFSLALGVLSFTAATITTASLAHRFAEASRRSEALVLLPPLATLCFGISVHGWDAIVAVPAALFVLSLPKRLFFPSFAASMLVAIPWESFSTLPSRTAEMAGEMAALHVFPPAAVSSLYWQVYLQELYPRFGTTFADFALKLPTWAGLAILVGCILLYLLWNESHVLAPATAEGAPAG